jgi:alpha-tubulin suppressor-like RCC1 family protein
MANTKVTVPFNLLYVPGSNTRYTKIPIAAVTAGTATKITAEKNHGLYGNQDLITIYDNSSTPFLNFVEYPATVIDGKSFTIPIDTTVSTSLCSNGYFVKRSSFVGPVRENQDYNDVSLSVTLPTDVYIDIEKEKRDFGIQTEVDVSMLGIPREEITTTQIEEVTRYGLNNLIWQHRGWWTWRSRESNSQWWTNPSLARTEEIAERLERYTEAGYLGTGLRFLSTESCVELYAEQPPTSQPYLNPLDYWYPGEFPAGMAFWGLETKRPFKYLPGRANVFTFGVKTFMDNLSSITDEQMQTAFADSSQLNYLPGNVIRWGVGNSSDAYYFELSGNAQKGPNSKYQFSVNRRRHYKGDRYLTSRRWYVQTERRGFPAVNFTYHSNYFDDPFYSLYPFETKFNTVDPEAPELTKVSQEFFSVDTVDGKGPSGATIDPSKVVMYKIEFSWYGAAGVRFFAYLPTKNNAAEWILLHEIEGGQVFKEPVLNSPVMNIKYGVFSRAGGKCRLNKYGVSCYIEGADEGTMTQDQKFIDVVKEVGPEPKPIIGVSTATTIRSSYGEDIPNGKVIFPKLINISSDENALIEILWKPTSNLLQGVTQGPILKHLPAYDKPVELSAVILPNQYPVGVNTGNFELRGSYNLRALTGNFISMVKDVSALKNLPGTRIFENRRNTDENLFWIYNPYTETFTNTPLQEGSFLGPNRTRNSSTDRARTGIFSTYISAVGDYNPNTGPDEWFKTCDKGDVIWLTRSLSGFLLPEYRGANAGLEFRTLGPFNIPFDSNPGDPNHIAIAFTSLYNYATATPLYFNFETLDRQAISKEIFAGFAQYWLTINRNDDFSQINTNVRALEQSREAYIGRYFLRNYIRTYRRVSFEDDTLGAEITLELPHLIQRPGQQFRLYYEKQSGLWQAFQLSPSVGETVITYVVDSIISPTTLRFRITQPDAIPENEEPQSFLGDNFGPHIIIDELPEYIPPTNINFLRVPYTDIPELGRRWTSFGLPIDRTSLNTTGGPPHSIYPRGVANSVSCRYPIRPALYQPGLYSARVGVLTAIGSQMTFGFPASWQKRLDNVSEFETPAGRIQGEPWRLVYTAMPGVGVKDAIIITNYNTNNQNSRAVNWIPLSSAWLGGVEGQYPNIPNGPRNVNVATLSCTYPSTCKPSDTPPNFIPHVDDSIGSGARIDVQSTQPLYYKKSLESNTPWIPRDSRGRVLGGANFIPRTIAAFYLPKNTTKSFDISQYFGIVAEYLSNSNTDFNSQPWGAVYITARTVGSAAPIEQFLPNNINGTGNNTYGQLGLGNLDSKTAFVQLPGTYRNVVAGIDHTILFQEISANSIGGTLLAAGRNNVGQLGLGSTGFTDVLTPIPGTEWYNVVGNYNSSFALSSDGTWCATGENTAGQLGLESLTNITEFTRLSGNWADFRVGNNFVYALSSNGKWFVAGNNSNGQFGLGSTGESFTTYQELENFDSVLNSKYNWKKISCGNNYILAISATAEVALTDTLSAYAMYGTGLNTSGQLGVGDTIDKLEFTRIPGEWLDVECGHSHTLAISSDGKIYTLLSTGLNLSGQLGLGNTTNTNTFNPVFTSFELMNIKCGGYSSYVTGSATNLLVAGSNQQGELGLGSSTERALYFTPPIGQWIDVYPGAQFTLAKELTVPPPPQPVIGRIYGGLIWEEQ